MGLWTKFYIMSELDEVLVNALKHMVWLDQNGLCIRLVLGCSHFNIGAFMEKGLTMAAGQTPVQKYWYVCTLCCPLFCLISA